jgi:hypothetical protein
MGGQKLKSIILGFFLAILAFGIASPANGQQPASQSQEISDIDGRPVLLRHLPDYERVQAGAIFTTDKALLPAALGMPHPILETLEFPVGTEAVTAAYPEGKLLIVEYSNPQASSEADVKIQQFAATHTADFVYRRIGNYNAFVFNPSNPEAANALLSQIKYEKVVQWLGEDPYILKRLERYMVTQSRDIMISTVFVILGGLGTSILTGIAAGFIFFRFRDQKRANRAAFSDAGGLTRLNLDGLSE